MTIYYSIFSVLSLVIIAGIMGCFVVWRNTEYYGDALSHALMIGAALAVFVDINQMLIMASMALLISFVVVYFTGDMHGEDLIISIISNGIMSISIVVVFFFKRSGYEDFEEFLLGEIHKLKFLDFCIVLSIVLASAAMFFYRWEEWVLISINKDLAVVDIFNKKRLDVEYYAILSVFIAIAIKIVGILLVTSILTIPPAISRYYAKNISTMIIYSVVASVSATIVGLLIEFNVGIPFAAVVVVLEFFIFIFSSIFYKSGKIGSW